MKATTISARDAKRRIDEGTAVLVDIREPLEHARENIPCAKPVPLSKIEGHDFSVDCTRAPAVIFHCQSGNRTNANLARLRTCGFPEIYVLEGGIGGWKAAGLATRVDKKQPIELQRQVMIVAGSLVLVGLALAITVSPWFAGLSAFVGAGLTFAGISGWCGMARLLMLMPWNRRAA
jgi:rhodanese-related sulfurtransferase